MEKKNPIVLRLVFILAVLRGGPWSYAWAARPSSTSSEKYDGYTNETRSASSTAKLDRIFTPKVYPDAHHVKRSGIGIEKGPPDLQFGLAFTVPFVSLSTQRLLNQVATHRGYDSLWDLANVLKLNVGGLVVAALVGVAALIFLPTLLPRFSYNQGYGGYGGGGGGGWAGNGFGGFFPGFLDQLIPGFGLNKPLGYGQTDAYPYKDPYYGSYSERKENQGKSRALDDDANQQNQTGNFWSNVFREVRNTAKEFETCALYAICERGKNESTITVATSNKDSRILTRGGRKEDSEDEPFHMSSIEHILEAVKGIGGNDVPGLAKFKKAFENGKSGQQCTKYYKQCPLSNLQIGKMVQNLGDYVFN